MGLADSVVVVSIHERGKGLYHVEFCAVAAIAARNNKSTAARNPLPSHMLRNADYYSKRNSSHLATRRRRGLRGARQRGL